MVLESFVVVAARMRAEELDWSGMEALKVVVAHWKRWSRYCMGLLVKGLVADLPLQYSLSCLWGCYYIAALEGLD
jgi:hypothetical protein